MARDETSFDSLWAAHPSIGGRRVINKVVNIVLSVSAEHDNVTLKC